MCGAVAVGIPPYLCVFDRRCARVWVSVRFVRFTLESSLVYSAGRVVWTVRSSSADNKFRQRSVSVFPAFGVIFE